MLNIFNDILSFYWMKFRAAQETNENLQHSFAASLSVSFDVLFSAMFHHMLLFRYFIIHVFVLSYSFEKKNTG